MRVKRHGWAGRLQKTQSWMAQKSLFWHCHPAVVLALLWVHVLMTAELSQRAPAQGPLQALWDLVRALGVKCLRTCILATSQNVPQLVVCCSVYISRIFMHTSSAPGVCSKEGL